MGLIAPGVGPFRCGRNPIRGRRFPDTFTFQPFAPIWELPGLPGYGDKWCRVIDAADPGAVPGGSTT